QAHVAHWCLVFHAPEQRCRPAEIVEDVELAALLIGVAGTLLECAIGPPERIGQVAAAADIAPAQAQAQIERPQALGSNHKLATEKTRTSDVAATDRDSRPVA